MSCISCGVWQWHKKNLRGGGLFGPPPARNRVKLFTARSIRDPLTCEFDRLHPFADALLLSLDNVPGDGRAAVVLRRLPLDVDKVLVPVGGLRTARGARLVCKKGKRTCQ